MPGEDSKKQRGKGATNAWGDHDTRSKSHSGDNFGNGGKGEEWLYRYVVS